MEKVNGSSPISSTEIEQFTRVGFGFGTHLCPGASAPCAAVVDRASLAAVILTGLLVQRLQASSPGPDCIVGSCFRAFSAMYSSAESSFRSKDRPDSFSMRRSR